MSSFKAPRTPLKATQAAKLPGSKGNMAPTATRSKQDRGPTDPDVHADPALFHELVEEPDLVFADDIYALGVSHAGIPDHPQLTRKSQKATGQTTQAKLTPPSADDLYWDDKLIHEVVEEPEYIFGEDIDALGVAHAGVPR